MLRAGGTATIVGMVPFGTKIELHGFDFLREAQDPGLVDGLQPLPRRHAAADRVLPRRQAAPRRLDLRRIKLSEINEGFANMKAGKVVRSVIEFN